MMLLNQVPLILNAVKFIDAVATNVAVPAVAVADSAYNATSDSSPMQAIICC